jgi:uncharacterized membrane protein YhdT
VLPLKKSREYFQAHHKVAYLVNLSIMLIFVWLVPYYLFGNSSFGYIFGIVLAIIVVNIVGAFWYPWFVIKSKK